MTYFQSTASIKDVKGNYCHTLVLLSNHQMFLFGSGAYGNTEGNVPILIDTNVQFMICMPYSVIYHNDKGWFQFCGDSSAFTPHVKDTLTMSSDHISDKILDEDETIQLQSTEYNIYLLKNKNLYKVGFDQSQLLTEWKWVRSNVCHILSSCMACYCFSYAPFVNTSMKYKDVSFLW